VDRESLRFPTRRIAELQPTLAHANRLIDGEWAVPSSPATIEVVDSSTELPWGRVAAAQEADMSRAIGAARQAVRPWGRGRG
jgi:aldehyde dehydrogenase (NAD+)